VLAQITDDERLRTVLVRPVGLPRLPAEPLLVRDPGPRHQALFVRRLLPGRRLRKDRQQLLQTVADAGGWTRIAADVAQILVEDGTRGRRAPQGRRGDPRPPGRQRRRRPPTVEPPPPERVRDPRPGSRRSATCPPAPAHVCLYLGFKGDIRQAGAGPANKWFYNTWDHEADVWHIDRAHRRTDKMPDAPVLYCSFPSLKDPNHDPGPEQRHTGEVVTFVPWDRFAGWLGTRWQKRGGDYDDFKGRPPGQPARAVSPKDARPRAA
jgi:all-trans-retinol 13,14-reductase